MKLPFIITPTTIASPYRVVPEFGIKSRAIWLIEFISPD
jgi:hypothetical protein